MLLLQTAAANGSAALTLSDMILKGGWVLIPIILLLFWAIYLIVERFLFYLRMSKLDSRMVEHVKADLVNGKLNEAIQYCNDKEGVLAMVLHSGLKSMSYSTSVDDIEKSMEGTANIIFSRITNPLSLLGVISGVAPMLGFVGTILGIIRIFYDISFSDNISIGVIAGGLYEKMITSFAGLVVGIIAYAGYHIISYFVDKHALDIEMEVSEFMNFLKQPQRKA